jgi:DNA-binding LytR/AlgR family response regulator
MKSLPKPPPAIFTTAYSNYAVEGFNLDAIDFLLKPFAYERFLKSVNKAGEYLDYKEKPIAESSDFIFVRADYQIIKINLADIRFIEGMDDYVKIFAGEKMIVTNIPMKEIYRRLPSSRFVRVHRSFIVPLNRIESVRNKRIKVGDKQIPIGESYADSFYKTIGENG